MILVLVRCCKRGFYRVANGIFGKASQVASEEVII